MRGKILSVLAVLFITLTACQGADNAQQDTTNPNIDPTTNRNTGDGMLNNDHDYMMDRDADRNQNRNGNMQNNGTTNNMNNNQMNNNQDGESNYEMAEEAAEKITDEVEGIDNAYVLTTDRTAYVAATMDNDQGNGTENRNQNNRNGNGDVSERVKEQISEIVRSVDGEIENVYVSTNPDFMDLVTNYADDLDQGRPIGGFFDQIGTMIDRIFPENNNR